MVVEEGVASPQDIDRMWEIFTKPGVPPFRLMDEVGLDIVLNIEEHYAHVREGIPEGHRKLLRKYIDEGQLGMKSGSGFYDHQADGRITRQEDAWTSQSSAPATWPAASGRV